MKTILINNKHYQECDVVMLATGKSKIGTIMKCLELSPLHDDSIDKQIGELTLNKNSMICQANDFWQPQHLYIISSEPIKDDLQIDSQVCIFKSSNGQITTLAGKERGRVKTPGQYYSIIATTDSDLLAKFGSDGEIYGKMKDGLLQIPQLFIQHFINEYNKGNVITKVLVKCEEIKSATYEPCVKWSLIKINPDNEISVLTTNFLNLDVLTSKVDTALENETEESLTKWLEEKRSQTEEIPTSLIEEKQETLEEAAENYYKMFDTLPVVRSNAFIAGAKWQTERMYSEEDMIAFGNFAKSYKSKKSVKEAFEQYKKK